MDRNNSVHAVDRISIPAISHKSLDILVFL